LNAANLSVRYALGKSLGELNMRQLLALALLGIALAGGVSAYAYFTQTAHADCGGSNC